MTTEDRTNQPAEGLRGGARSRSDRGRGGPPDPAGTYRSGEGGPGEGSSFEPRGLGSALGPSGAGGPARGAGDVAGPRARAGQIRQDARLAVRVLPGCGLPHGRGPRLDAAIGDPRPGVRRRARVELRPVRVPRAGAAVRHQRLRRDPPRPVGVGREAPRGEPRRRRAEQRVLRCRARRGDHGLGRRVPDGDAGVRVDAQPRRLVLAHADPGGAPAAPGDAEQEGPEGGRAPRRARPNEGQHPGVRQADPRRGRASRGS